MALSFNGSNQISSPGYQYDAAGNLLMDGVNCYTYDAENRLSSVAPETAPGSGVCGATTMSYLYDPEGRRVARLQNGQIVKQYYYDAGGHMVTEANASGTWLRAEIYAGDRHLATWASNATYFNHADWLGTERARSNSSGARCETITSLPFGDGETTSGTCTPTPTFFTGLERDAESGLDHTLNRQYPSSLGRWLTPDPAGLQAVNLDDPQASNMYAYVRNNPTTLIDPDGERYEVCQTDANGTQTNCADISDEQFAQFQQANKNTLTFTGNGNVLQNGTVIGSYEQTSVDPTPALIAVGIGTQMAAPGVNLAYQGLRAFGYAIAALPMAAAECAAGAPSCTTGNVAMALLPEVSVLREGATLLKEGAAAGKGAEILQKGGGMAEALKDYESLQGVEKVYGSTKVKTLADGTKAVLYESTGGSGRTTLAFQHPSGTVTKIRY